MEVSCCKVVASCFSRWCTWFVVSVCDCAREVCLAVRSVRSWSIRRVRSLVRSEAVVMAGAEARVVAGVVGPVTAVAYDFGPRR